MNSPMAQDLGLAIPDLACVPCGPNWRTSALLGQLRSPTVRCSYLGIRAVLHQMRSERSISAERASHFTMINSILWVLHTEAQWRELPERYGKWSAGIKGTVTSESTAISITATSGR